MENCFIKFLVNDIFINIQNIILKFLKQKKVMIKDKTCNIRLKGFPV